MKEILNNQIIPLDMGEGWKIDIVVSEDTYEAWIYYHVCGIKELMFGVKKATSQYKDFCDMVEANFEEYRDSYEAEYMQA